MLAIASGQESRAATHPSESRTVSNQVRESPLTSSGVSPTVGHWLVGALDELDYGIVLLFDGAQVVHINHAAHAEMDMLHPLRLVGNELRARWPGDGAALHAALRSAALRGLRCLLTLGQEARRSSISIIPLEPPGAEERPVLVVLGRSAMSEALSIQGFARSYGLTSAETRVLVALSSGLPPGSVARQLDVAISTVRSQIGSVRLKTGAASIRSLIRQVSALPPVKSSLRLHTRSPRLRLSDLTELPSA